MAQGQPPQSYTAIVHDQKQVPGQQALMEEGDFVLPDLLLIFFHWHLNQTSGSQEVQSIMQGYGMLV
jgi:hypothetical protein